MKHKAIHKSILVLGGYGNDNAGDEAQLDAVIARLTRLFPEHMIRVLSHNPDKTYAAHNQCCVDLSPRVAFFNSDKSRLYKIRDSSQCKNLRIKILNFAGKILFLWRTFWIYINALFVKQSLPTFLLSARAAGLLFSVSSCDCLYFCGGGYLTGKTLSRLWDGILMCNLAALFDKTIVMSGQTIGVWGNRFNKWYARKAFARVKIITLRDCRASVEALHEIGISGDHVYPVCDDALFCAREERQEILNRTLEESGFSQGEGADYIVLNIHDWGISEDSLKDILSKIHRIVRCIQKHTDSSMLFVPMTPTDVDTMVLYNDLFQRDQRIPILQYPYDYRIVRGIISRARLCVTMKHHPIIFAIGETVPCIALNYSDYYRHKNCGALDILGMGESYVNLEENRCVEQFEDLLLKISGNDTMKDYLSGILDDLKRKNSKFEKELVKAVGEGRVQNE